LGNTKMSDLKMNKTTDPYSWIQLKGYHIKETLSAHSIFIGRAI